MLKRYFWMLSEFLSVFLVYMNVKDTIKKLFILLFANFQEIYSWLFFEPPKAGKW